MKCSCWFHSEVKFLTRFLRLFWLSHFALVQCNFYRFLAHLSQRLKWAIVIAHRPLSVVRPSVNFHIFDFFSRTAWWILMKLGRYEVLMVPYKCCCFSAISAQGRIQGGAKIYHGGPLLQEFWRVFDVYLDLVILLYFNAISIHFYAGKCLIYIYFV